jgi:hypothetical protein
VPVLQPSILGILKITSCVSSFDVTIWFCKDMNSPTLIPPSKKEPTKHLSRSNVATLISRFTSSGIKMSGGFNLLVGIVQLKFLAILRYAGLSVSSWQNL